MDSKNKMNSLKHKLPKELISKIQNINCKKNINGNKKSNELILIFDLDKTAKDVHNELIQWLLKCLDTISYKVKRYGQYEWNIISQIKDNDYDWDAGRCDAIDYKEENGGLINSIMVAIHINDSEYNINSDFTIPYDNTPDIVLSPQEIVDCLINEPNFVKNIGVSAVSSKTMMFWWEEMISTEPNILDSQGKGYMVHPMWIKFPDGSWSDIRERSFNFGWKGYSPKE